MRILDYIKENILVLDGAMGTLLQAEGLKPGELPETWNISHPYSVVDIHKAYFDAGSNVVSTNTFGANTLKFPVAELEKIISSAINNARLAQKNSKGRQEKWIALDIGPTGRMLKPFGDLDFEDAVGIFAETVKIGVKCGVDLILIETMTDCFETKAALLAAKENSSLPVFVLNAYGSDGKLLTGADPLAMIAMLEGMGADAIGVNCSFGPEALKSVADKYLKYSSVPFVFKPNAGIPECKEGKTVYNLSVKDFASFTLDVARDGAMAVGGCCGTTPEHIRAVANGLKKIAPLYPENKNLSLVSSYTHAVEIGKEPILIGERINPTGKPKFRDAVKSGDIEYILKEAVGQEEQGAHILDVNLGIAGIDEPKILTRAVSEIQSVCDLPLQIDSSDPAAMESAIRRYNGKAMINSVNGKRESLDAVLPLVKKYGGVVVALTLDENGIPERAEDRFLIAKNILAEAEKCGIDKKDIIFDPLAMSVSADKNAANETLSAVKMIKEKLGANVSLGISNVSFGLPNRDKLNAVFLTMALNNGLSAAIINPYSEEIMSAYHSYLALSGADISFEKYLSYVSGEKETASKNAEEISDLKTAIIKGLGEKASKLTKKMLENSKPLDIVNGEIIPALNEVGIGYENKKIYLPGLLMSAEAAGRAFDVIKDNIPSGNSDTKCHIVLATVKGDIHDIGKNIVKLILENYGYSVTDLGKNVEPKRIVDTILRMNAKIVGLSALMTTTLPAIEETVKMIKKYAPNCKIMVGGAVLSEEYAKHIGADFYGKDAIEAVKYAEIVNKT